MIAADTSTWIAFLEGDPGEDTEMLDKALQGKQVLMVPAVLTEILSDPKLPPDFKSALRTAFDRGHFRILAAGRAIES